MEEPETFPLVRAISRAVVKAGGEPHVEFGSADMEEDLLRTGNERQVSAVPEMSVRGIDWADVYIGVRGATALGKFEGVPVPVLAGRRAALGTVSARRTAGTRWVLVRVPTETMARDAGMTHGALMEAFFQSVVKDWSAEAEKFRQVHTLFEGGCSVRVRGPGTDIELATAGRAFLIDDGHINMPGGEIYTSPVEDSADGRIRFSYPGVFAGQVVEGIELQFRHGRVVDYSARTNQELLSQLLRLDEGANCVGEFGIGTNRGFTTPLNDPLIDEKIWGTMHLALGRSYASCGGLNNSALHWDIVTDLRDGGEVTVDGTPVFIDGGFVERR